MTAQTNNKWHPVNPTLAPCELKYLSGMAQGSSIKEVARANGVSPNTVTGALKRIYYKLSAHRVAEAVYKATRAGLLGVMMALTVFSLVNDDPYTRAPRNRPRPAQTRVLRGNRSARSNRMGDLSMLASLLPSFTAPEKRNQFREKTFAVFMEPPSGNTQRLETYRMKRMRVNQAARQGAQSPSFPLIVFRT